MGREVRKVPADWVHPKDSGGGYVPLHDRSFALDLAKWDRDLQQWLEGFEFDYRTREFIPSEHVRTVWAFVENDGPSPRIEDYMPDWNPEERTHFQMYQTVTEGSPISPVFRTAEELAKWLAETGANAWARRTASYEQWLIVCHGQSALSFVIENGVLRSGVEAMADVQTRKVVVE